MTGTHNTQPSSCLSRTSLMWTPEGELEKEDLRQVLVRLAAVDGYGFEICPLDATGSTPNA